jgi:DoxX-like family
LELLDKFTPIYSPNFFSKMKRDNLIYWITTSVFFLFDGVMPAIFSQSEMSKTAMAHLGYPPYFLTFLTICKVAGALALIIPQVPPRVKEWAYAGFAFSLLAAAWSNVSTDGFNPSVALPFVALAILMVSHHFYHKLFDKN